MNARTFLDQILTTEAMEGAGRAAHDGWRAGKAKNLADPNNPYKGYGPERRRVRDFTEAELNALGISAEAREDPGLDVYNPVDVDYGQLDPSTIHKNTIPLTVMCYTLADFILPARFGEEATLEDLDQVLTGVLDGSDAEGIELMQKLHHVGFQCGVLCLGDRPYGPTKRDDFKSSGTLHLDVKALDVYSMLPAAKHVQQLVRAAIVANQVNV